MEERGLTCLPLSSAWEKSVHSGGHLPGDGGGAAHSERNNGHSVALSSGGPFQPD